MLAESGAMADPAATFLRNRRRGVAIDLILQFRLMLLDSGQFQIVP
jgi:hypothetical protein